MLWEVKITIFYFDIFYRYFIPVTAKLHFLNMLIWYLRYISSFLGFFDERLKELESYLKVLLLVIL